MTTCCAPPAIAEATQPWKGRLSFMDESAFSATTGEKRLLRQFEVAGLDAFGNFSRIEIAAAGAVLDYLAITQKGLLPRLDPPRCVTPSENLQIDPATRRNLELLYSLDGLRKGSLVTAIDRTVTGPGARLLADRLASPLARVDSINARLAEVAAFVDQTDSRREVRQLLRHAPDLSRALSRLAIDRGGPRDLSAIGRGLAVAASLAGRIEDVAPPLAGLAAGIRPLEALAAMLDQKLVEQPPLQARDGGFVADGADQALDELRRLRDQGKAADRRARGALQGRDGNPVAEDPPQQHDRLLCRGHGDAPKQGAGTIHPAPGHGQCHTLCHRRIE